MSDDDDSDPKLKALFQQVKSKPVSTEEMSLECTQLLARLRQIPEAVRSEQTAVGLDEFSALPFQQIGQYELLERIAGGGMGEVFKARQQKLGNLVAIKLLYRDRVTDRQLLDRFEQEMRAVGRLNHENIVKPLYADEQNGVPYLVMEYVAGRTLTDLLEEYTAVGKPFPIELACESIRQAAIGLDHAHQHGIIHRDIKPSNLMLTGVSGSLSVGSGQPANGLRTTDNKPTLKILDLGLARLCELPTNDERPPDHRLTHEGQVMGTPAYMSPEQASGHVNQLGPVSDVYSLGATFYELLSGTPPFTGFAGEILVKIQSQEPQPLRSIAPHVPRDLETICQTAMQKEPSRRYVSAAALAEDVRRFVSGEAILARRQSLFGRAWHRACRRPLAVSLSLVTMVTLAVGALFLVRGHQQRQIADLVSSVDREIDAGFWSDESLAAIEEKISRLHELSSELASQAQFRLTQQIGKSIEADLKAPVLSEGKLADIRQTVERLARRNAEQGEALLNGYQRRLTSWQVSADWSHPHAGWEQIVDSSKVRRSESGLIVDQDEADDRSRLVLTQIPSQGSVRWSVQFDSAWDQGGSLGLAIDAQAGHLARPSAISISPDGKFLATGDERGEVFLWNVQSGECLAKFPLRDQPINWLAFRAGNRSLVVCDGKITVLDFTTRLPSSGQPELPDGCTAAAISNDGELLAACDANGGVHLWNFLTEKSAGNLATSRSDVMRMAFSADRTLLAVGHHTGLVQIYQIADHHRVAVIDSDKRSLAALAFSPDAKTLAVARRDTPDIEFWDLPSATLRKNSSKESQPASSILFLNDGLHAITLEGVSLVTVHDPIGNRLAQRKVIGAIGYTIGIPRLAVLSPDGTALFVVNEHGQIFRVAGRSPPTALAGTQGYFFRVVPSKVTSTMDPPFPQTQSRRLVELRKSGGRLAVEIWRNQTRLRSVEYPISRFAEGPLQLTAIKSGDRLRFEVGELPPVEFLDTTPTRHRAGEFGIEWPIQARLVSLRAERKTQAESSSPLEQGDASFANGDFSSALTAYLGQAREYVDAETGQRARYSAALCLLSLGRDKEAEETLTQLAGEADTRWSAMAAMQLWVRLVRKKRFTESDVYFEGLSTRFQNAQLAELIPNELRDELVQGHLLEAKGIRLFQPDKNLVARCERAIAIADLLRGTETTAIKDWTPQISLVRACRAVGDEAKALRIAQQIFQEQEDVANPTALAEYCWMLRLAKRYEDALRVADRNLAKPPVNKAIAQAGYPQLILERARTLALLDRWEEAEQALENLPWNIVPEEMEWDYPSYCALRGFFRARRGDEDGAMQAWKDGLQREWLDPKFGFRCVDGLILASLTNVLTDADAEEFVRKILIGAGDDATSLGAEAQIVQTAISVKSLSSAMRTMFRSPRGREASRQFVFRELAFAELLNLPPRLLANALICQGAFGDQLSKDQDELVWQVSSEFSQKVRDSSISNAQIVQLGLAWKGVTNFLGWGGIAQSLEAKQRGQVAYVLGHRYLRLKQTEDAVKMFREAVQFADDSGVVRRLAQTELNQLNK